MSERVSAFGTVLRQFREAAGLSQELLAERAGLSLRGVSDLERGMRTRPRLETIRMLADGLGLEERDRAALLAARNAQAEAPSTEPGHPIWSPLPLPAASLIGREPELGKIMALLQDDQVQLVTLTGPGGVGKTRIALETAHRLASGPFDGAVLIDLSPVRETDLVIQTIASRLGVVEVAVRPAVDAIAVALKGRNLLMVLDNLEQVIDSANDIADMLSRCPSLTILATSRIVLHIAAERVVPISPLEVPEATEAQNLAGMAGIDAVALFVERARAADATFAMTEENCEDVVDLLSRLDGLPLAIELAAARTRMFTPRMLVERLERGLPVLTGGARDAPERQRTMRNAIAWSYGLLSPVEQMMFRRLAIFVGGCTLETAEAVIAASSDVRAGDVADGLETLVNNSLLRRRDDSAWGARYVMLQTIREFGLEQLVAHGEESDVRDAAHRAWYMELACAGEWLMTRSDQIIWMKRFDAELANLRDHMTWLVDRERIVDALQISGSLWFYLWIRGYYTAARDQWEELLAHPAAQGQTVARGRALIGLGVVSAHQGDTERSLDALHEAKGIFRVLGEGRYLALALLCEGTTHTFRSDFNMNRAVCEECHSVALSVDDDHLVQAAVLLLANSDLNVGKMEGYREKMQAVTDATRALKWPWGQSIAQGNLGLTMFYEGKLDEAEEHLQASARITMELGSKRDLPLTYLNLADISWRRGDREGASSLMEKALQVSRDMGESKAIAQTLTRLAELALEDGDPEQALALMKDAQETFAQTGDMFSAMTTLTFIARIAMELGEPERAAWCIGAEDGALERHGVPRWDPDNEHPQIVADVVAALGEPGWRRNWSAGYRQDDSSAIATVLAWGHSRDVDDRSPDGEKPSLLERDA